MLNEVGENYEVLGWSPSRGKKLADFFSSAIAWLALVDRVNKVLVAGERLQISQELVELHESGPGLDTTIIKKNHFFFDNKLSILPIILQKIIT